MQRGGPLEAGLGPSGYREQILTRMFENPEAPSINKIPQKKQDLLNLIYAVVSWSSTTNYEYIYIYIYTYPRGPYVKVIAMMSQAQSAEEIFPSRWKFASPCVQQELSLLNKMNAQLDY